MDEEILVQLSEIVSHHPWWAARADIVLALLDDLSISPPTSILDAGCGWGTNLRVMEAAGYRVVGLDVSRRALDRLDRPDRQLIEAILPGSWAMRVMFHIDRARTLRRQNATGTSLLPLPLCQQHRLDPIVAREGFGRAHHLLPDL